MPHPTGASRSASLKLGAACGRPSTAATSNHENSTYRLHRLARSRAWSSWRRTAYGFAPKACPTLKRSCGGPANRRPLRPTSSMPACARWWMPMRSSRRISPGRYRPTRRFTTAPYLACWAPWTRTRVPDPRRVRRYAAETARAVLRRGDAHHRRWRQHGGLRAVPGFAGATGRAAARRRHRRRGRGKYPRHELPESGGHAEGNARAPPCVSPCSGRARPSRSPSR